MESFEHLDMCRAIYGLEQEWQTTPHPDPVLSVCLIQGLEWLCENDPEDRDIHLYNLASLHYQMEDYEQAARRLWQAYGTSAGEISAVLLIRTLMQPDWDGYDEQRAMELCQSFPESLWCRFFKAVLFKNGHLAQSREKKQENRRASWNLVCTLLDEMEMERKDRRAPFFYPYYPYAEAVVLYCSFLKELDPAAFSKHQVRLRLMEAMLFMDCREGVLPGGRDEQQVREKLNEYVQLSPGQPFHPLFEKHIEL